MDRRVSHADPSVVTKGHRRQQASWDGKGVRTRHEWALHGLSVSYNAVIVLTDRECVSDEVIAIRRHQWTAQLLLKSHTIPLRRKTFQDMLES